MLAFVAASGVIAACQGATPALLPPTSTSLACDGHTNDAPALQAMLDRGGRIALPQGICAIAQTLHVTQSDTFIIGQGGGFAGDGPMRPATGLLWTGRPNCTLLAIGSPHHTIQGGGIARVGFESHNGLAAIGLEIQGVEGATFTGISASEFSVAAIDFGPTPFNNMHNLFRDYSLDNEINKGVGIRLGTLVKSTAYYNEFQDGFIATKYGTGIAFLSSDGNVFLNTHEVEDAGGTGTGVLFGCRSTSNHMIWLSVAYTDKNAKGVVVLGQNHCGYPHQSWANSIQLYDQNDNGGPPPIVGTYTDFWCRNDARQPCGQSR